MATPKNTVPRGKVSTPLVLAMSSGMITIGLVAAMGVSTANQVEEEEVARVQLAALVLDDRSAEAVAESFLDAWRRRSWDEAAGISSGVAHESALQKKQIDADMDETDRVMARQVWERLAGAPLEVLFRGSENLEGGAIALDGVAAYDFMGAPYRREVHWEVEPAGEPNTQLWRVRLMQNGEVLSDAPALLRGEE